MHFRDFTLQPPLPNPPPPAPLLAFLGDLQVLQGDADEEKPGNVTLKYDIEPLPCDLTSEQRFFEGVASYLHFSQQHSVCFYMHVALHVREQQYQQINM